MPAAARTAASPALLPRTRMQRRMAARASSSVPSLVVFDLDACLWLPEMYQLACAPSAWDAAAGGVRAGREVVRLFPGALHALAQLASEPRFAATRIALASSTSKPDYARAVLAAYQLSDCRGGTFGERVSWAELYPISHKGAHFRNLQKASGIPFADMLFFDDCTWSDNCGEVSSSCPGVVGMATPDGMTVEAWEAGLSAFEAATRRRANAA